jgi:hypothetical protein
MNMFSYMKDVGMGIVFALNAVVVLSLLLGISLGWLGLQMALGFWPLVAIPASLLGFAWNDPTKRRTT